MLLILSLEKASFSTSSTVSSIFSISLTLNIKLSRRGLVSSVQLSTVVALILVTAFLIGNTIKLAIYSRKREIEIMRLVGASNISIKIPFILEGLFIGILGSIAPIAITIFGYSSLYEFFDGELFGSALATLVNPIPFVYYVSIILVGIGIVVGMVGSYLAVRKYLKI